MFNRNSKHVSTGSKLPGGDIYVCCSGLLIISFFVKVPIKGAGCAVEFKNIKFGYTQERQVSTMHGSVRLCPSQCYSCAECWQLGLPVAFWLQCLFDRECIGIKKVLVVAFLKSKNRCLSCSMFCDKFHGLVSFLHCLTSKKSIKNLEHAFQVMFEDMGQYIQGTRALLAYPLINLLVCLKVQPQMRLKVCRFSG